MQLEKKLHILSERQENDHKRLETRLLQDVHALDSRLNDISAIATDRITAQGNAQRDAHQALHSQLHQDVHNLSLACHTQLEESKLAWTQQYRWGELQSFCYVFDGGR